MTIERATLASIADAAVDLVVARLIGALRTEHGAQETKSSLTDHVTEFDRWSEATIIEAISAARPDDGFIGEEGTTMAGTSGVIWVLDPIDGTTNFVYDLPGCSVSLAARVGGVDSVGVVHDLVRDERFRATLGRGATLDGRPIRASARADLATALVATGFSYEAPRRRAQATVLAEVIPAVRDIRRFGGAAVDLCSVACGRVDAYYERGLSEWDFAAGALIATEAGAAIDNRSASGGALAAAGELLAAPFFALIDAAGAHTA